MHETATMVEAELHVFNNSRMRTTCCSCLVLLLALPHIARCQDDSYCETEDCDDEEDARREGRGWMHLAVVACGERLDEPLTMLKSAIALGRRPLHAHVWADEHLQTQFQHTLSSWADQVSWRAFRFSIYPIEFPFGHANEWRSLFKTCACQRLFIPHLLNEDAVLYVDTDVLFTSPIDNVWLRFNEFNEQQVAALAPEGEDPVNNWYARFAKHPFVEPTGVNSGVMLMNLTRMRAMDWGNKMWPIYVQYRGKLTWGDQCLLNVFFHDHPHLLHHYDCTYNYRPDHCMYTDNCPYAGHFGVRLLHGSRGYFHKDKQKLFRDIYAVFNKHPITAPISQLVRELKSAIARSEDTSPCKHVVPHVFTRQLESWLQFHPNAPYAR